MKFKSILTVFTVLVLAALVLAGQVGPAAAHDIPEEDTPTDSQATCEYGKMDPEKELDVNVGLFPGSRAIFGGVITPTGSANAKGVEMVCKVPADLIASRYKFRFQRSAIEVRQYIQSQVSNTDSNSPKTIYFDLTPNERVGYEKVKDNFNVYWYDPENYNWVACPDTKFDEKASANGRISCSSSKWGFFAVGWPVKNVPASK
jgi:hypothetical protein